MADRDILDVMDQIVAVAPDLEIPLNELRESVYYTAPEAMGMRWGDMANILAEHCRITHPKFDAVVAIF